MEIRLWLPGNSAAEDIELAREAGGWAAKHAHDGITIERPSGVTNECDGCDLVKVFLVGEVWWGLYDCGGVYKSYPLGGAP